MALLLYPRPVFEKKNKCESEYFLRGFAIIKSLSIHREGHISFKALSDFASPKVFLVFPRPMTFREHNTATFDGLYTWTCLIACYRVLSTHIRCQIYIK